MGCVSPFQTQATALQPISGVPCDTTIERTAEYESTVDQHIEQMARQIAPLEKYGYQGYLLSPDHGLRVYGDGSVKITGKYSLKHGYNCYDINKWLAQKLREHGREARVVAGRDEQSYFQTHYFVEANQDVYDAIALYPFKGAKHQGSQTINLPPFYKSITNPIAIHQDELSGQQYLVAVQELSVSEGYVEMEVNCLDMNNSDAYSSFHLSVALSEVQKFLPADERPYQRSGEARAVFKQMVEAADSLLAYFVPSRYAKHTEGEETIHRRVLSQYRDSIVAILHKLAYPALYPQDVV